MKTPQSENRENKSPHTEVKRNEDTTKRIKRKYYTTYRERGNNTYISVCLWLLLLFVSFTLSITKKELTKVYINLRSLRSLCCSSVHMTSFSVYPRFLNPHVYLSEPLIIKCISDKPVCGETIMK